MPVLTVSPTFSPPAKIARPSNRITAIESVRGFACLTVVLFHSLDTLPPDDLHPILKFLRWFTSSGGLGVYIFFAVSGWCIAERLASAHHRHESVLHFMRERALRIYPTYWAALALLIVVRLAALPFNTARLADNLPFGVLGWLGDLLLLQPYLGTTTALPVSWTLVFELGFYAISVGALALRARGVSVVIIVVLASLLAVPAALGWQWPTACLVLGLWPEFFFGALAWCAARRGDTLSGRLSAVTLAGFALGASTNIGDFATTQRLVALGTAVALLFASRHDQIIARFTVLRKFAWVGAASYSLYLSHFTILSPLFNFTRRAISPHSDVFVGVWLVAVALSLFSGWLLHRWVEAPVERWRKARWSSATVLP